MAKNTNKKSDKKKKPAKKLQGHKIVVQKGGVAFVANNVDDSNFVAGEKNLVNSKEQKVPRKTKSARFSSKDKIPDVSDLPLGSHLPFSPNALFTGREKELKALAENLLGDSKTGAVITQAVTGMGGLGKTQLAVEFGYRYGKYFRGVHWINLADPTQLDSEIANCGRQMFTNNFPEDQPSQVALTLQTWKTNGLNLLILDNFEETKIAGDVLTKLRHSNIRVLVTSRHTNWSPTLGLTQLPLDLFSEEESLQFLKESLKDRKDSQDDLKNLAERLGYLPLGLELASRYLNGHQRLSISEYLKQTENALDHASMKNWRSDMPAATGHDLDLQRTFALSWQELQDETAQKIFMMTGYLAPNTPIPLEIFEKALEIEQEKCDEALSLLYGLGLFRKGEDAFPNIHPLLAEYAQSLAKEYKEVLEILVNELATLSNEANKTGIPANFALLRPHMPVLASYAESKELYNAGALWNSYGYYLHDLADYQGAKSVYEHTVMIGEINFGLDHQNIAIWVNNLGSVLQDLGDLHGAKEMYERALKIDEANFGLDNPNVARGFNNLGRVLHDLGDLNGAKEMLERAVKIDEANFGREHPSVARDYNNLALVIQDLGDTKGAKEMFERVLQIIEKTLPENHPHVAHTINNLGLVMKDLGDLSDSKKMFERALKIHEANFGFEHPDVAIDFNNLGSVAKDLGDLQGAREMFERALAIFKKFLPADHPNIKIVQENLDFLNKSD